MPEQFLILPSPQRTSFGRRRRRYRASRPPGLGEQFVQSLLGGLSEDFSANRDFERQMAMLGLGQDFQSEQRGLDRDAASEDRRAISADQRALIAGNLKQLTETITGGRLTAADALASSERKTTENINLLRAEGLLRDAQQTSALGELTAGRKASDAAVTVNQSQQAGRDAEIAKQNVAILQGQSAVQARGFVDTFFKGRQTSAINVATKTANRNNDRLAALRQGSLNENAIFANQLDSAGESFFVGPPTQARLKVLRGRAETLADVKNPTIDQQLRAQVVADDLDAFIGSVSQGRGMFGRLAEGPIGGVVGIFTDRSAVSEAIELRRSLETNISGVPALLAVAPGTGDIDRSSPEAQALLRALAKNPPPGIENFGELIGLAPEADLSPQTTPGENVFFMDTGGSVEQVGPDGSPIAFQAPGGEDEELLRRMLSGQGIDLLGLNGGFA